MSFTNVNHYVPQWYQKRFIPSGSKENKLYYLDLSPEKIIHQDGNFHFRKSLRFLGTSNCFAQEHLYTLFFGKQSFDDIEKFFFGDIDRLGAKAVEFFSNYNLKEGAGEAVRDIGKFLNAQKLRTPKGLDYLKIISRNHSHQIALHLMGEIYLIHGTIWSEGVWEILECNNSKTKFIISDHPVSTYNKKIFPGDKSYQYPLDAPIELVGTQTIFPLSLERCLTITNLEYVRFPKINPLKIRENARSFEDTLFDLGSIQTGRQISEKEVIGINFVIKKRSKRFIAAAQKEWLYPENHLKSRVWNKLGDRFFLMPDPRKVPFTTKLTAGGNNGVVWSKDEYGRNYKENAITTQKRNFEFNMFHKSKKEWDDHFGPLSREELKRFF